MWQLAITVVAKISNTMNIALCTAAEIGRNPVSKHQIQPEHGNKQADVRGDRRTRFATKFSGANGDREKCIFPAQLTTSRIGNHTRLVHTLLKVLVIHWENGNEIIAKPYGVFSVLLLTDS